VEPEAGRHGRGKCEEHEQILINKFWTVPTSYFSSNNVLIITFNNKETF
jgi:hypothetical protein